MSLTHSYSCTQKDHTLIHQDRHPQGTYTSFSCSQDPPTAAPGEQLWWPRPSCTHTIHPETCLEDAHTHTQPQRQQRSSPSRDEEHSWNQRSPLGVAQPGHVLGTSSWAAFDSPCRADQQRPGTWRTWSSSSRTLPPRCPHQLPAVSVSSPLCKATSCVTFTFTLSNGLRGSPFSSLTQPHISNAQGCDLWACLWF